MTWIQKVNVGTALLNTAVSITITLYTQNGHIPDIFEELQDSPGLGWESEMARSVYQILVPGQLFVGPVLGIVMGMVVPFIQHSLVQKVIYIWACLPKPLLAVLKLILPWSPEDLDRYPRLNAENCIQANPIGLAWDFVNLIINPSIAFFAMLFASPYVAQIALALLVWTLFYYCILRWMHFRLQS